MAYSPLQSRNYGETGTSEGLWDRLGRWMEIIRHFSAVSYRGNTLLPENYLTRVMLPALMLPRQQTEKYIYSLA